MKPVVRMFIAVDISPAIRSQARKALRPAMEAFPNVKWVDDDNFHVTLKFLGSVPTTELHRVVRAVETACRDFEQFDLVFEGVGAFPNVENPRTIWIGVRDGIAEITELAQRVDDELTKLGYPPENRGFQPHLTVGRARQKDRDSADFGEGLARALADRSDAFIGSSPVDAVVVYSSELERGGPKYDALAEIELSPLRLGDELDEFDGQSVFNGSADSDVLTDANGDRFGANFGDAWRDAFGNGADDAKNLADADDDSVPPSKRAFDFDALDDDLEAELRQICGDDFVDRNASRRAEKKRGDRPAPPKRK